MAVITALIKIIIEIKTIIFNRFHICRNLEFMKKHKSFVPTIVINVECFFEYICII